MDVAKEKHEKEKEWRGAGAVMATGTGAVMAPDRSNLILVSNLILLTGVESGGHNSTLLARVTSRHDHVHYGNLSDGGTSTSTLLTCLLMSSPSPQKFLAVAVAETRDWSVVKNRIPPTGLATRVAEYSLVTL